MTAQSNGAPSGKLLALDVGMARIGVAVCDGLQLTVRPLSILHRRSRNEDFVVLSKIVTEQEITAVICGLPLNMDGSEGQQAQTIRKWALRLAQALRALLGTPIPVIFWDERLTTYTARELMVGRQRPKEDDDLAATVILQSYLDAQRTGELLEFGRIDLPKREQN